MDVRIASILLAEIRAWSAQAHPHEACGLLYGGPKSLNFCDLAANVAQLPQQQFEIDPTHLFSAHKAARAGGPAIAGCWHSHPTGPAQPSAEDARRAFETGWLWLIHGSAGDIGLFQVVADGPIWGRFAPVAFTLID